MTVLQAWLVLGLLGGATTLATLVLYSAFVAAKRADALAETWCEQCQLPQDHCRCEEGLSGDKSLLSVEELGDYCCDECRSKGVT
jgi:hypothetical protein